MPLLDPDVADLAPSVPALTAYDELHAVTYLGMLDADAKGADWREVARIVLHIDPYREPGARVRDPSRPRQMDKGWDTGTCFAAAGLGRETADGCKFRSAATRQLFISRRTSTGLRAASRAAFAPPAAGVVLTSDPVGILVTPLNRARSFGQKGTFAAGIGPVGRGAK